MAYKKIYILLIVNVIIFLIGCKQADNTKSEIQEINKQNIDSLNLAVKSSNENIVYLLPAPGEVLEYINYYQITYNPDLLNSSRNYKNYMDEKSAALNIGIYISDLAYTSMFKKNNESLKYLEVIEVLMDQIKISSAIDKSIIEKIKDRYNILDSLADLSSDVFDDVIEYLKIRRMHDILSLISLGGYIEGLNITINIIDQYDLDEAYLIHLMDQKYIFENLYKLISPHFKSDLYSKELMYLEKLKELFENFYEDYEIININKDVEKGFKIASKSKIYISEEDFYLLKKEVENIRKDFVNE